MKNWQYLLLFQRAITLYDDLNRTLVIDGVGFLRQTVHLILKIQLLKPKLKSGRILIPILIYGSPQTVIMWSVRHRELAA